ncbi:MAG: hypothetical protein H0T62_12870 [Parachlamydiaceae bacterium]|nr:hypothetical protein [Parachlamydiaceae bacterium]
MIKAVNSPKKIDMDIFLQNKSCSPRKRENSFPLISSDEPLLKKLRSHEGISSLFNSGKEKPTCSNIILQPNRVIERKEYTLTILEIANQFRKIIMSNLLCVKAKQSTLPATPCKKRNSPGEYEKLFWSSEKGCLVKGKESFSLTRFAKGSFMNAYKFNGLTTIQNGVSNDKLLIKLYAADSKSFNEVKAPVYMQNSINNYHEAVRLGLSVSTIYNIETALTDKYFLVEFIPAEVDLGNEHHLKQVQHFIKVSYENKIPFDLSFSNLRVKEDGTVTLIDFVEKPFNFTENYKLLDFTITYLKSWVKSARDLTMNSNLSYENRKELARQLLSLLTEDLEVHGFSPQWSQQALSEYFFQIS